MIGKYASLIVGASLALANTACEPCHKCKKFQTSTDLTVEKIDRSLKEPREHFTNMADNAMLHDMSVADIHFVPHSAELSGTGAARLNRMATLLDAYGGTVRYETFITDEALVKQRLDNVREYLALTGCEMDRVSIKTMISGGRGMTATKAVKVDAKGTAKDAGKGGSAPAGAAMMTGQP
jgi:hypothetical protein